MTAKDDMLQSIANMTEEQPPLNLDVYLKLEGIDG